MSPYFCIQVFHSVYHNFKGLNFNNPAFVIKKTLVQNFMFIDPLACSELSISQSILSLVLLSR